jgi:hypothetical protein
MAGITTYLSILTLNVNRLNSLIKNSLANWIKKEDPKSAVYKRPTLSTEINWLRVKDWKKIYHANVMVPENRQE